MGLLRYFRSAETLHPRRPQVVRLRCSRSDSVGAHGLRGCVALWDLVGIAERLLPAIHVYGVDCGVRCAVHSFGNHNCMVAEQISGFGTADPVVQVVVTCADRCRVGCGLCLNSDVAYTVLLNPWVKTCDL